jgi:hypothetical protein
MNIFFSKFNNSNEKKSQERDFIAQHFGPIL